MAVRLVTSKLHLLGYLSSKSALPKADFPKYDLRQLTDAETDYFKSLNPSITPLAIHDSLDGLKFLLTRRDNSKLYVTGFVVNSSRQLTDGEKQLFFRDIMPRDLKKLAASSDLKPTIKPLAINDSLKVLLAKDMTGRKHYLSLGDGDLLKCLKCQELPADQQKQLEANYPELPPISIRRTDTANEMKLLYRDNNGLFQYSTRLMTSESYSALTPYEIKYKAGVGAPISWLTTLGR